MNPYPPPPTRNSVRPDCLLNRPWATQLAFLFSFTVSFNLRHAVLNFCCCFVTNPTVSLSFTRKDWPMFWCIELIFQDFKQNISHVWPAKSIFLRNKYSFMVRLAWRSGFPGRVPVLRICPGQMKFRPSEMKKSEIKVPNLQLIYTKNSPIRS